MNLFTIGYERLSAAQFFPILAKNGIKRIIDVRLYNTSVYAGYTRQRDFQYFLSLFGIGYHHLSDAAPDKALLSGYKAGKISWQEYEGRYTELITSRELSLDVQDRDCLLCFEREPEQCHRRVYGEMLIRAGMVDEIHHIREAGL